MTKEEKIQNLINRINELPKGSLSIKKVKNKIYYYHRWYENKVRKEKYISHDEVKALQQKILLRKELLKKLKKLDYFALNQTKEFKFQTAVRFNDTLRLYSFPAKNTNTDNNYDTLSKFLYEEDKYILTITGEKKAGKTTLIRQVLFHMNCDYLLKTALISINKNHSLNGLKHDLMILKKMGAKFIFIDEITLLNEDLSTLSEIITKNEIKFVLIGTKKLNDIFTNCIKIIF